MISFPPPMKVYIFYAAIALAFLNFSQCVSLSKRVQTNAPGWDPRSTPFPPVRRVDTTFQYNSEAAKGKVSVADPYNWFEKSDASNFVQSQLAFTKTYLDKLEDLKAMRSAINQANFPKVRPPTPVGPKDDPTYSYYFNEGGYSMGYLYVAKQKDIDQAAKTHYSTFPGKVFIDESLLNGELLWLQNLSPDGSKALYTTCDPITFGNGKLFVRDLSSPLTDKFKPAQEGGYGRYNDKITDFQYNSDVWADDNKSFFYVATDSTIKYHIIGTDAKNDMVFVQPNKDNKGNWWVQVSDDGKFILIFGTSDTFDVNRVFVASLDQGVSTSMSWLCISPDYTFAWDYVTNVGNEFYFRTSKGAPNQHILRFQLDFTKATKTDNSFSTFTHGAEGVVAIAERTDATFAHYVTYDTDKILTVYDKNDLPEFIAFNLKTGVNLQTLDLGIMSTSIDLNAYFSGTDVYAQVSSLNTPAELYYLKWNRDTNKFTSELIFQQKTKSIDPATFIVERQWVPSKTGDVKVPIFVLHRKGLSLDGSHPVIINFYGAYAYVLESWYDSHHMAFVHSYDAIYILASPRGGGDLGDDWHKAGQLQNKQNTFDDIISVAQYAVDQKWTSPGKVIINVQSAGASAAAAIVNQAPEGLFGAFIGTRGMYDMLRSDQSTDKVARAAEYGSPSDPKAFDWLRKYSPLHNIDPKKSYPSILIYPPQDDDAGSGGEPWQSYKYISELQYDLPNNPNPILLGNGTDSQEERSATAFALAAHTIGFKRLN